MERGRGADTGNHQMNGSSIRVAQIERCLHSDLWLWALWCHGFTKSQETLLVEISCPRSTDTSARLFRSLGAYDMQAVVYGSQLARHRVSVPHPVDRPDGARVREEDRSMRWRWQEQQNCCLFERPLKQLRFKNKTRLWLWKENKN